MIDEAGSSTRADFPSGDRAKWMRDALEREIHSFRRRRRQNRSWAFSLKLSTATLSALATVALGLRASSPLDHEALTNAALVATAFVSVLVVWEGFLDSRWLWIKYTQTLTELYSLRDQLGYAAAGVDQIPGTDLDEIYSAFQNVLRGANKSWAEQRARNPERKLL